MDETQDKKTVKKNKKVVLDENAKAEAVKKVNALLSGTGLEDKAEDVFTPPIMSSEFQQISSGDNANEWLQEQVTALTKQVEDYEALVTKLRTENTALVAALNGGGNGGFAPNNVSDVESYKTKILELYKHFEQIYTGRNTMRQAFDTVKFSNPVHGNGVLDVLLQTFVFLNDVKQYRHRG